MLPLSLSYDHRVIDGAAAARFVVHLVERALATCAGRCCERRASEVRVPDIGDFTDVPVIEIHVAAGDEVAVEDPLVTLESDKATMDVPAPFAGVGQADARQDRRPGVGGQRAADARDGLGRRRAERPPRRRRPLPRRQPPRLAAPPPLPPAALGGERDAQVLVIGSGPGGYTAAFRAADLGPQDDPDRALRDARRRLPERRLHPVQGAAARRAGGRRGRGDGRARDHVRQAEGRPRRAAGVEGVGRRQADRRPRRPRASSARSR